MTFLVLGLVVFIGLHLIRSLAPQLRLSLIARLGDHGWRGLHSLIALAGLALMIYGFSLARLNPVVIWVPPPFMKHIAFTLLLPVFPLLLAAYMPGYIRARLKHPMLTAIKFWALAHLLVNGTLAHIVLFGSFLAWAVVVRISAKRNPRPQVGADLPPKLSRDVIAVGLGLAIYVFFLLYGHLWLIGVSPLN